METGETYRRVVAHRGGKAHGRENDAATITRALAYKPDIVEVDVRKSWDGVLYCYHGSVPLGVSAAQVYRFLTFQEIQAVIGKRNTLAEILDVIPDSTTVLLDLKDSRITGEELAVIIGDRRDVWMVAYWPQHLRSLQKALGDKMVYIFNHPLIFLRNLPMIFGLTHSIWMQINGQRMHFAIYNDLSKNTRFER